MILQPGVASPAWSVRLIAELDAAGQRAKGVGKAVASTCPVVIGTARRQLLEAPDASCLATKPSMSKSILL